MACQVAQARLLILHGAGGHAGALWPAAALAASLGFEVLVPDLPGYGQTRVLDPGRVRYPDWVDCVSDLVRAENQAAAARGQATPPVTLVHPAADRWTPPAMSLAFFDRIAAPKRYVALTNCGHFPVEEPGMGELAGVLEGVYRES